MAAASVGSRSREGLQGLGSTWHGFLRGKGGGRALTLAADPGSLDGVNWEKEGSAQKKWERATRPPDRGAGRPSASQVPFCNPLARFMRRKDTIFLRAQLAPRLYFHVLSQLTAPGGWRWRGERGRCPRPKALWAGEVTLVSCSAPGGITAALQWKHVG